MRKFIVAFVLVAFTVFGMTSCDEETNNECKKKCDSAENSDADDCAAKCEGKSKEECKKACADGVKSEPTSTTATEEVEVEEVKSEETHWYLE